jgi:hypothetical protein
MVQRSFRTATLDHINQYLYFYVPYRQDIADYDTLVAHWQEARRSGIWTRQCEENLRLIHMAAYMLRSIHGHAWYSRP